jgi:methylamine dehydrogenase heavy chain
MESGKAFLLDADSGQMLGMLSTGFFFQSLTLPSDYSVIYSSEVYFTRGTRGKREDVVAYYDPKTLSNLHDVDVPPKKAASVPLAGHANLTTDNRFMAVYNFTPAQSVTIVDLKAKALVQEVETPGCAQVYTAGARAFNMVCGDGTMLTLRLDDTGKVTAKDRSPVFYDPKGDTIDDKVARLGDVWYFFTISGTVKPIDMAGGAPKFLPEWSLFGAGDEGWRAGGFQYAAINPAHSELYMLVHQGGLHTHKDPGKDIWVYDIAGKKRVRKIALGELATSIGVSEDAEPLLYTIFAEHGGVHVYDARSGKHLRHIEEVGFSPTMVQPVPLVK